MPTVGSGSLFRIKLFGEIHGQQTLNVFWYYRAISPDTHDAVDVVAAFENGVAAHWEALVSSAWDGTLVECDELTSLSNFFTSATNIGPGTASGESLGPFVCFDIRLLRTTKETRSGRKRIAGVTENQQNAGVLESGTLTTLNLLAEDFDDALAVDLENIDPVIVRQTRDPDTGELEPVTSWIYNLVADAEGQTNTTTQGTRKYNRGN